jgi:enoyl-CoA hydratase/carnithine racemase
MTSTTRKITVAAAEGTVANGGVALAWLTVLIFWARRCERHRSEGL